MLSLNKLPLRAESLFKPVETVVNPSKPRRCRAANDTAKSFPPRKQVSLVPLIPNEAGVSLSPPPAARQHFDAMDPLYLFACHIAWERDEDPSAGWELIGAAQSFDEDTRAHARALLSSSHHLGGIGLTPIAAVSRRPLAATENNMKAPYGLDIIDDCSTCTNTNAQFFCGFSPSVLESLNQVSHKSTLPAGAILFVEGQAPRGMFIICSGKVNLSTTSREGKILILKTANAGEALGLSASISGVGYETTAETATPCQLAFVERKRFLELLDSHSEMGTHTAQCLSRDYQMAYRDIHDLVLTRSSAGKLARLLLSQSSRQETHRHETCHHETQAETRVRSVMTHEEMAQRIGASRETVTRLLSHLRKKQLIRVDGSNLIIHDRTALEALAF
jgi:CRP/FNR family cyclic AMP-dependent transcriptional regulator